MIDASDGSQGPKKGSAAGFAGNEPPSCAACNEHCNIDCPCGSSHHYCGCECHLRQEKWALEHGRVPKARKAAGRRWRSSGVAWFWGDDREDFGSVIRQAGHYVATTVRGSAEFEILGDAKTFVEEHSS